MVKPLVGRKVRALAKRGRAAWKGTYIRLLACVYVHMLLQVLARGQTLFAKTALKLLDAQVEGLHMAL